MRHIERRNDARITAFGHAVDVIIDPPCLMDGPNLDVSALFDKAGGAPVHIYEPIIAGHVNLPLLMFHIYAMVLASSIAYIRKIDMGRKKLWDERILLPLASETLKRLDSLLAKDEARLDLIREAIERELRRRERMSR